jgi:exodeoxyribonuclease-1
MDVLRLCHALRPDGINWPTKPDGKPSFKLEDLTRANGIAHEAAHDALSDVRATLALARLLRDKQPRLFDFALGLRNKKRVLDELCLPALPAEAKPFLHVSGMFSPERGCLALMWPLAMHPNNRNELLAWDLAQDPRILLELGASQLRERLFTPQDRLPEGVRRLPLKSVHLNQSPMVVANLRTLKPELAAKWGIDLERGLRHAELARAMPDLSGRWSEVFARPESASPVDVDQDLYGSFLGDADRGRLNRLRGCDPADPAWREAGFDDPRLPELVFRYRARNFPATLTPEEIPRWQAHCQARLLRGEGGALSTEALLLRLDQLQEQAAEREDERAEVILSELYDYADAITPEA